jgi:hypothetical protein
MLDAYRDLTDELLETPNVIRGTIDAQGEGNVPAEVRRLIAGLRDRDRAVLGRVQSMTRQETPYVQVLRLEEPTADDPLADLLAEMETARGDLVSLLINLSLKDWERPAIHETEGEITLADEIERHVEFDEDLRRRLRELMS